MPNWAPPARSYATRILANRHKRAREHDRHTRALRGELRILAAIDFVDGQIVRWIDYWDSTTFDDDRYTQFRTRPTTSPPTSKTSTFPPKPRRN